jgi:hypothetical protein
MNTMIASVTARTQPHQAFARQLKPNLSSGDEPVAEANLSPGIGGGARLSGGMGAGDGAETAPLRSTSPTSWAKTLFR